jgi:hypothetical protein
MQHLIALATAAMAVIVSAIAPRPRFLMTPRLRMPCAAIAPVTIAVIGLAGLIQPLPLA